eukprot:146359-Pyramimonas_sp.AAC.1
MESSSASRTAVQEPSVMLARGGPPLTRTVLQAALPAHGADGHPAVLQEEGLEGRNRATHQPRPALRFGLAEPT